MTVPPWFEGRINELRTLKAGWLDGKGLSLDQAGLDWVERVLAPLSEFGVPYPHLYPTPDGNVSAEWSLGPWEVCAMIDLSKRSAVMVATDCSNPNRDDPEGRFPEFTAERIAAFINRLQPKPAA